VDGETFIEKYTRGVSAVETILTLDRLRQSVAVKELVNAKAKLLQSNLNSSLNSNLISNGNGNATTTTSQFMRKTVSVPNISHVSKHRTICLF
jgi:kinesin family protein 13